LQYEHGLSGFKNGPYLNVSAAGEFINAFRYLSKSIFTKNDSVSGPLTHAATGAVFGVFGYFVYHWEERQNVLIEQKHKELGKPKWDKGKGFIATTSWTGAPLPEKQEEPSKE
jgi:hypothetical protein